MIFDTDSPSIQQFRSDLAKQEPVTRAPAGFGESFMRELGHYWRENLSISRNLALDSPRSDRAQRIREVAGDDAFIKAITIPGDPQTHQMVDSLAAEHERIYSDAELMGGIKERNGGLRAERDEALKLQTTAGKIGGFAGTMVGALSDPLVLGTLPLGASWATGIVRTMLTEAGINMAVEAALQPAVYSYKQELESAFRKRQRISPRRVWRCCAVGNCEGRGRRHQAHCRL